MPLEVPGEAALQRFEFEQKIHKVISSGHGAQPFEARGKQEGLCHNKEELVAGDGFFSAETGVGAYKKLVEFVS